MKNNIVVITGASSGIGKMTAIAMAKRGAKVIMVCRNRIKAKKVMIEIMKVSENSHIDLFIADFSDPKSIIAFGKEIRAKYGTIDVLVNNAGAIFGKKAFTSEQLELTFAVNHMGYFLTTHELLPLLKTAKKGRIVNVASEAHRFSKFDLENLQSEKSFSQLKTYGLSKLCNILFTKKISQLLAIDGITANALHPGVVGTNFGSSGNSFFRNSMKIMKGLLTSPEKGAETSIFLASAEEAEGITGKYWAKRREKTPSKDAQNQEYVDALWAKSLEISNISQYGQP